MERDWTVVGSCEALHSGVGDVCRTWQHVGFPEGAAATVGRWCVCTRHAHRLMLTGSRTEAEHICHLIRHVGPRGHLSYVL